MAEAEIPIDRYSVVSTERILSTTEIVTKDMNSNKDSTAVEKEAAVNGPLYLRNLRMFERIVKQIRPSEVNRAELLAMRESRRRSMRNCITSNRECSQLRKVWTNRGLPVDRESLQAAATGKDTFDMHRLSESLPSEPYRESETHIEHQQGLLAELYRKSMRNSENLEVSKRSAHGLNNNHPSCSSNSDQPVSLSNMAKRAYGNMRRVLGFKPSMRARMDSCCPLDSRTERIRICISELQEQNVEARQQRLQLEQKECSLFKHLQLQIAGSNRRNWNIQNNHQNLEPESFHFVRNRDGRQSKVSLQMQQLHDSVILSRQMSRLSIANSRRDGVAKALEESEMKEDASDKIEEELARKLRERRERMKQLIELIETNKMQMENSNK